MVDVKLEYHNDVLHEYTVAHFRNCISVVKVLTNNNSSTAEITLYGDNHLKSTLSGIKDVDTVLKIADMLFESSIEPKVNVAYNIRYTTINKSIELLSIDGTVYYSTNKASEETSS